MKRIVLLSFCFFLAAAVQAQMPVILRVSASEQQDSTGCNFVRELCRVTYDAILEGKAPLWDSQTKEMRIGPSSLRAIEKSAACSFLQQEVVFIYEYWDKDGRDLKSTTSGFYFSGKNKSGEDVSFGYMDFADLQEYFLRSRISTNANGNYNSNIATYLNNKNYNYQLLQFAGKVVDNVTQSKEIKEQYIGSKRFNVTDFSSREIPQKMVTWLLDTSSVLNAEKALAGKRLLESVQYFLAQNEEVLYNLGGDHFLNHLRKNNWRVTRIEVQELWKKIDGQIYFDPVSVVVYANDSALTAIPFRDMQKYDIQVGLNSWVDYVREKPFQYAITQVNGQPISRRESFLYQKALLNGDWRRITDFVKYY